jgi:glutamate-1-semialdehyde 2,1-aminomutase
VIVEPVITDMSEARIRWLQALREACTADGAMLVFDEVITGFRLPKFSVAGHTGITPDLLVMGKAMANGMPLAAVGGKYDVMNQDYFISSTYAGEILSLAAGLETMTLLQTKYLLSDLWEHGAKFVADFNSMGAGLVWLDGYPTRGVFKARDELTKALFWQECCRAGMLWGPSWFFNFPLIAEYPSALIAMKSIVTRIKNGEVKLEGEMPRAPVAQKMREEVRA